MDTCADDAGLRVVVLEGEPGLGRSRLCGWLARTLLEGGWMTVAAGRHQQGVPEARPSPVYARPSASIAAPRAARPWSRPSPPRGITDLDAASSACAALYPETGSLPPARARRVRGRPRPRPRAQRPCSSASTTCTGRGARISTTWWST
ncbi:MAG: hypothetical protein R3F43_22475 [bacterium]